MLLCCILTRQLRVIESCSHLGIEPMHFRMTPNGGFTILVWGSLRKHMSHTSRAFHSLLLRLVAVPLFATRSGFLIKTLHYLPRKIKRRSLFLVPDSAGNYHLIISQFILSSHCISNPTTLLLPIRRPTEDGERRSCTCF